MHQDSDSSHYSEANVSDSAAMNSPVKPEVKLGLEPANSLAKITQMFQQLCQIDCHLIAACRGQERDLYEIKRTYFSLPTAICLLPRV